MFSSLGAARPTVFTYRSSNRRYPPDIPQKRRRPCEADGLSSAPTLLLQPLQRRRIWIDRLEPQGRAPGLVSRADLLGHDALQAKLADVLEGDVGRGVDRLTDQQSGAVLS